MTRKNGELDQESVDALQILLHKIDNQPDKVLPAIREIAEVATKTLKSQTNVDLPRRPPWLVSAKGARTTTLSPYLDLRLNLSLSRRVSARRAIWLWQVFRHATCGMEERWDASGPQGPGGPRSNRSEYSSHFSSLLHSLNQHLAIPAELKGRRQAKGRM